MSDFLGMVDRAAGAAVCNILSSGGNAVLLNAVVGGALVPGGQVPALAAGLGLVALNAGCAFDPNTGAPPPPGDYCTGRGEATGMFLTQGTTENENNTLYGVTVATVTNDQAGGRWYYRFEGWNTKLPDARWTVIDGYFWKTDVKAIRYGPSKRFPGTCTLPDGGPTQPGTYSYTDASTGCSLDVDFLGWGVNPDGFVQAITKVSPAVSARASGGIISGCNFSPIIHVGGGGGGGGGGIVPWQPLPDLPDVPPWWVAPAEALLRAAVAELIRKLFETKFQPITYRIRSVCETAADGSPVDHAYEVDIPSLPGLEALVARLDSLAYVQQGLKDFKQPICPPERFKRQGEPVTVRFQSDEPSDLGNRRLDKRLVYLDQSASPLETHSLHWADFSWQSGPVCVIHKGAPWGVPQVWAASVDEGKRVLRHAGQIAGVDPDQVGEWIVTGTADQRIGQIKTMRVMRRAGALCVSKRAGGSGLPLLMVDPPRP